MRTIITVGSIFNPHPTHSTLIFFFYEWVSFANVWIYKKEEATKVTPFSSDPPQKITASFLWGDIPRVKSSNLHGGDRPSISAHPKSFHLQSVFARLNFYLNKAFYSYLNSCLVRSKAKSLCPPRHISKMTCSVWLRPRQLPGECGCPVRWS